MSRAAFYPTTHTRVALAAVAVTAAVISAVSLISGVPPTTSFLLAGLVLWQTIAGVVVWRWLRPSAPALEMAGAAIAVGSMLAALAGVVTATVGLNHWGWLFPSAISIALVAARRTKRSAVALPGGISRASLVGFLAAALPGLAIILNALRSYPLTWSGTWTQYHPDMPFFEAISVHLAQYGAFQTPFLTEGSVRYHWLSYAWAGQLTVAADAAPFITLTRVLPVVAVLGSSAMVASWTHQLSRYSWTPALAGLLLSVGGFAGAVFGGVFSMDSPSQSMSALWLIAFSIALIEAVRASSRLWLTSFVLAVMAFALTGGKVSAAAPAVAGALTLAFISIARRDQQRRRATWMFVATAVGAIAGFAFFLAGSLGGGGLTIGSLVDKASSQQGLNPIDTKYAVVAGTVFLAMAVLPRWAGLAWLLTDRQWRWRPEVTYSLGLAVSSLVALLAFNSFNEVWFSSTVSGPLSVITAVGVGRAVQSLTEQKPRRTKSVLVVAALIALAISIIVWMLWATGASGGNVWVPTWRWLGPPMVWGLAIAGGVALVLTAARKVQIPTLAAGMVVLLVFTSVPGRFLGFGTGLVGLQENGLRAEWFSVGEAKYARGRDFYPVDRWTDSRMRAARWLRENANPADLVATNLTVGPFVSGVTHMPTYVSGIGYQSPYGLPSMSPVLLKHEEHVWDFIESPSAANVEPLCASGVTWLWVDLERAPLINWEPFFTIQLATSDTVIAQVNASAC